MTSGGVKMSVFFFSLILLAGCGTGMFGMMIMMWRGCSIWQRYLSSDKLVEFEEDEDLVVVEDNNNNAAFSSKEDLSVAARSRRNLLYNM